MKKSIPILVILHFLMINFSMYAEDYSKYIHLAMEKLEQKDCDAARKLNDIYKELSGKKFHLLMH